MKKTILSSIILLMMLCMQSTMPAWAGYCWYLPMENWTAKCLTIANAHNDGIDHTPADDASGHRWYDVDFDDSSWDNVVRQSYNTEESWKVDANGVCYLRRHFTVDDLTQSFTLSLSLSGKCSVYINEELLINGWCYGNSNYGLNSSCVIEGDNVVAVYFSNAYSSDYYLDFGIRTDSKSFSKNGLKYETSAPKEVRVTGLEDQDITDLNIPDSVTYNEKAYAVTEIRNQAFYGCSFLTEVKIPNSVLSIGEDAFYGCSGLSSLRLGQSLKTIGYEAFRNCTSLKEVKIPNSVLSIGEDAFYGCSGLSSLELGESLTTIGNYAFCECTSLKEVKIPNSVLSIEAYAFHGCSSLGSLELGQSLTTIGNLAFFNCTSLKEVKIPNSVLSIGDYAFYYCSNLSSLDLGESLTTIGNYAFCECTSLKEVKIPNSVLSIGANSFSYCSSLSSLDLGQSLTTIGNYAFCECTSLKEVKIPNSVLSIGENAFPVASELYFASNIPATIGNSAFSSTNALVVPSSSYETYESQWSQFADIIFADSIWTTQAVITQNSSSSALHRTIGEENLGKIGSLKLSGSMNSYDLMIIRNKMVNLRHLDLSDCRIKANSYEFYTGYCTQDDTLPDMAFYDMDKLLTITLPKELKYIGSEAFSNSSSLRYVKMPLSLENMGKQVFDYCTHIDSVTIPEGVKSLPDYTFYECHNLKQVKLPNSLNSIGNACFYRCYNLDSLNIPDNVTNIRQWAFYDCSSLSQIHLSKRLTTIDDYAFYNCSSLKSVSITSMIESIGDRAFAGCDALDTVYTYTIEPTSIDQYTFAKTAFQNATLMVPRTSYYVYYYNTQWSQFVNLAEFDQPYEFVYLNNDYTLDGTTGIISGSPIVYINPTGALITESGIVQNSDEIVLRYNDSKFGTVMATDNVNASRLTLELTLRANRWYYLCFPCDVKRSELTVPGDYVIYTYNGETRAKNGSGGWQKLGDTEGLKRGQGYILQCNTAGTLTASVEKPDLKGQDYEQTLTAYDSDDAHNANWNFIGNPFTAYMPIQKMSSKSPITVWNASTKNYEAYSTQDDAYVLEPCQCFFVQKPTSETGITFQADGRMSYTGSQNYSLEAPAMRGVAAAENPRRVINLTLTGNETSDKTRVVLNEEAQLAYEMECDASKFMGSNDVQLYTIYNNVKYAINERPVDNHEVVLGYMASAEGSYTIAKSDKQTGISLYDKQTGVTTDLSKGGYSFETKAGTFDDRFVLKFAEISTEIQQMEQPEAEGIYYNAAGICMGSDRESLPAGTYLYKSGETTNKVVIK